MDQITIDLGHSHGTINPNIYGHFAEHIGGVFYDGLWVGEDSPIPNIRGFRKALVESFAKIKPPVLRWPGGCFAETYDWRDGIGPREQRPTRVNWWYSHDKRTESNQVGTHEFMDFCRMVGAEPYFAANMTTVPSLHIRNWIEYCNFPAGLTTLSREREANGDRESFNIRYWGIGNENWGGGGQMTPEMCTREYIRFSTVCNSLDKGNLRFILCGANAHDIQWTRRLMKEWAARGWQVSPTYGMSIHYYANDRKEKDPVNFTEDEWYQQLFKANFMQRVLDDHRAAMDEFDPERKVALIVDEWGNWHTEGYGPTQGYNLFEQPSNMRDAVVAAMTLNIFNDRCDSVAMANVAQLCNNLHSLYLAKGPDFVETPNYHVFDMYKTHQGGIHRPAIVHTEAMEREGFAPLEMLSASASEKDGVLTLTLANLDLLTSREAQLNALAGSLAGEAQITVLAHTEPRTCNTFEAPQAITPHRSRRVITEGETLTVPAASVVSLEIKLNPQRKA